jgi:hypothetical protein
VAPASAAPAVDYWTDYAGDATGARFFDLSTAGADSYLLILLVIS